MEEKNRLPIKPFDTRVVIKGEKAKKIREKLDEKMLAESRKTYSSAIEDILTKYFRLDTQIV